MINVFIVGCKGIPARYGGFETFVENLTKRKKDPNIKYFVSSIGGSETYEYNNATCVGIPIKKDSSFNRIINVSDALKWVENYIFKNNDETVKNIVYILGCRVGILLKRHVKKLHSLNCLVVSNPDGLEWKRSKWNWLQKKIIFLSEKGLVKNSDKIICDSIGIKDYILNKYNSIRSNDVSYIAYGCDLSNSKTDYESYSNWIKQHNVSPNNYYLVVGRFVPENNFELIIKEYMLSNTTKKLLIISNVEQNSFYNYLQNKLHFFNDNRIIFAGTCYDSELVKKIREEAFCYIHGHSVGGTNPSLLEALGATKLNLLYDVPFNREVGSEECLYFSSQSGCLSNLINQIDQDYISLQNKFNPKSVIEKRFKWDFIVEQYEKFFGDLSLKQ